MAVFVCRFFGGCLCKYAQKEVERQINAEGRKKDEQGQDDWDPDVAEALAQEYEQYEAWRHDGDCPYQEEHYDIDLGSLMEVEPESVLVRHR